jgi:Mg-chelatase subunit ChlD
MTRRAAALLATLSALSLAPAAPAAAQADSGVTLVRCGEKSASACLHVRTTLAPATAGALAPREGTDGGWRLRHADTELPGRPAAVPRQARPPLRLLVLVDVSGSMSDGGLQTARSALRAFLADLPAGSVRAAVVPFASARVAERIRAARFVPAPQAAAQVDALPSPEGNTALYSAVRDGMQRLGAEPAPGDTAWNALLVVTDGRNDVGRRGDDPGLLAGQEGRRQAVEAVRASGAYAWMVGIGAGLDAAELRALGAPRGASFIVAEDPVALRRALERIQGWIFTGREFLLPVGGSAQARLAAGPARVQARAGGASAGGTWVPPVFALPAFQGRAAGAVDGAAADPWRLRRAAVLAFFAGVLLILWTAVPPLLRSPPPPARAAAPAFASVPQPVDDVTARRRIRLRTGGAPVAVAGVVTIAPDGLRTGLTEAPPRRPTDVTAKVSRPMQRT